MRARTLIIPIVWLFVAAGSTALAKPNPPPDDQKKIRTRAPAAPKAVKKKKKSEPKRPADHHRRRAHKAAKPPVKIHVRRRAPAAARKRQAPVVRRFERTRGARGTTVVLHGHNFHPGLQVRLGGRRLKVVRRTPTALTVAIPTRAVSGNFELHTPGLPRVVVARHFEIRRPPRIRRVRPNRVAAGQTLTIHGVNFAARDQVMLGNIELRVRSRDARRITVDAPPNAARGRIGIRREGAVVWASGMVRVLPPPPIIESLDVTQGEPGTVVRIRGRHFAPRDHVALGGRRLAIRKRGPRFIEVVVPPGAPSGLFTITGRSGRRAVAPSAFTVLHPPRIRRVSPRRVASDGTVTIHGTGFLANDAVLHGNSELQVLSIGPARITAKLPAGPRRERIGVRRGQTVIWSRRPVEVLSPPPVIEASSVDRGAPGTVVRIRGRHFLDGDRVTLGSRRLVTRRRGPNFVEVVIPVGSATGRFTIVRSGGRRVVAPSVFTVYRPVKLGHFYPKHGTPGTEVRIRGRGFHAGVKVYLGPTPLPISRVSGHEIVATIPQRARSAQFSVESHGQRVLSRRTFRVDPARPALSARLSPSRARPGTEVTLRISPPQPRLRVFLNGRKLPKKVLRRGGLVVVTVPAGATSGYFEVEHKGVRVRAEPYFKVLR